MVALFGLNTPKEGKQRDKESNVSTSGEPSPSNGKASDISTATLPLPLTWLKTVSGCYCADCATAEPVNNRSSPTKYDLEALKKSTASPLVLAPMSSPTSNHQDILAEYMAACRFYGCGDRINAGVLTCLRFSLPSLRVTGDFHDSDMLALVELLLRHANGALQFIHRLDFGRTEGPLNGKRGFGSHGALTLAKVLQTTQHVKEVWLPRNFVGPYGASALFIACSSNPIIKKLVLRRCRIGEQGALVFAELIATSSETGLIDVDLSANRIGFRGSLAIEQALMQRNLHHDMHAMTVDLEGNLVLQEVMNGVTHGLGTLLALLGCQFMSARTAGMSQRHVVSCGVYSASLLVLYSSSTLYHSFFSMRTVKWIFEIMDKSAIYILIAGSYTPFLQITLPDMPIFSEFLLAFLWICCVLGIGVEACFPTWKYRTYFSLAMYLSMGWSALVCLPEVAAAMSPTGFNLIILGGVAYTAGVPFFVRNNNLDHAIWHVFVLAGSIIHWLSIYFFVAPLEIPAKS